MPLATAADVERFADLLTECADSIHQRLITAIRTAEINPFTAQQILQDEATLRQRANGLYMDAAQCIITDLGDDQVNLNEVIRETSERISEIAKIAHFIDIVSDLLVVVSSVYAAQPGPILAALQEIRQDIDTLV